MIQRCTTACLDNQFRRLVADDAAVFAGVERLATEGTTVKALAEVTLNSQRCGVVLRLPDLFTQLSADIQTLHD